MTNTLSNKDRVPEWAVKEVCRRTGESHERYKAGALSSGITRIIRVAAEILAEHEEPPVDPLRSAIEEALDWWDNHTSQPDPVGEVVKILRRRGIEIAREQGS